ncbi:MAG: cell division ATP-binding protein FtsE [Nitrospinaceae bacterium]
MIQVYNVSKTYAGVTPALSDVSFSVKKGEFVFLTGPSGAGKTTLLKLLFRWETFDRGQVLVHGINVGKIKEHKLYSLRRKIGVVFQDYKLLARKTVFENVAFAQEIVGAERKKIRYKTWEALKNVGLTHKKDSYPLQLSGGEQQRVAIARALVNSPRILLADEPTGNLDFEISREILKLFEEANQQGVTVVFATHNQELIHSGNHPVVYLNRGRVVSP